MPMNHVFISYNQSDSDFAAVLMTELEKANIDTWLDKRQLLAGQDWSQDIDEGIRDSFALVVVMSREAKLSEYVAYEWSFAVGAKIPVIPVVLEKIELHPRLARFQNLDFTSKRVRPWDELVKDLTRIRNQGSTRINVPKNSPQFVRRAIEDFDNPNVDHRKAAIKTLEKACHPAAQAVLRDALSHVLPDVRVGAMLALMRIGDKTMLTVNNVPSIDEVFVCKYPISKEFWAERDAAVKTVNEFLMKLSLDEIANILPNNNCPFRWQALYFFSQQCEAKHQDVLLREFENGGWGIKDICLQSLIRVNIRKAMELAISMLRRISMDKIPQDLQEASLPYFIRLAFDVVLRELTDKARVLELLRLTLQSEIPALRGYSCECAGRMKLRELFPMLEKLTQDNAEFMFFPFDDNFLRSNAGQNAPVSEVAKLALKSIPKRLKELRAKKNVQ